MAKTEKTAPAPAEPMTIEKRVVILKKTLGSLNKAVARGRRISGTQPVIDRFNRLRTELMQRAAKGKSAWADFCTAEGLALDVKAEDLFPEPAQRGRPASKVAKPAKAPKAEKVAKPAKEPAAKKVAAKKVPTKKAAKKAARTVN
jgi:hypothetical protein